MTTIIKNSLRIAEAKDFLENFKASEHSTNRNHYLFVGKPTAWSNENVPDATVDSLSTEAQVWHEMLGCKKITETFTSLVVRRSNWDTTGNTVYVPFRNNDTELFNHPTQSEVNAGALGSYTAGNFYVVTDDMHIFKCLNNNFGAKSTVKPTLPLSSPYIVNTADGYSWKYLGTVTASQSLKFLTEQWLPIKTLGDISDDGSNQWDVEQNATDGTIDSVLVTNKGSNYTLVHSGTLVSSTSNKAILPVGASATTNAYVGATIYITGGTGYPSTTPKLITAYNSGTREITINGTWTLDNTTQYQILPTVTLVGDGSGAILKPIIQTSAGVDQYKLTSVQILSQGTGYRYATASISGCGGSGAVIEPQASPIGGHGKDIEKELGAFYASLNVKLEFNEGAGDFPVQNDYRQVGIIRNLKNYDGSLATLDTRIATKKLTLTGITGTFISDEIITGVSGGTTAIAKVVDYNSSNGTITFVQNSTTGFVPFATSMTLTGSISTATATISTVTNEEIKKFDGSIVYLNNRRAVVRSVDLSEDIKAIIEF